jgi:hypothetical protein
MAKRFRKRDLIQGLNNVYIQDTLLNYSAPIGIKCYAQHAELEAFCKEQGIQAFIVDGYVRTKTEWEIVMIMAKFPNLVSGEILNKENNTGTTGKI